MSSNMKVSYAITVSTEVEDFSRLMRFLISCKDPEDEIVVLVDESKGFSEDIEVFEDSNIHYFYDVFQDHFADWKNELNSHCSGDWIFQLDADELPSPELIADLHKILGSNDKAECFWVPRANAVTGITPEDIQRWGWRETPNGINWPDYQLRLYRNSPSIRWKGRVHERPVGYSTYVTIPGNQTRYKINHIKDIERQRKQNDYYSTLQ